MIIIRIIISRSVSVSTLRQWISSGVGYGGNQFEARNAHEATARLAYEFWVRGAVHLAHLKLTGLPRRRPLTHCMQMSERRFTYLLSRWNQTRAHIAMSM